MTFKDFLLIAGIVVLSIAGTSLTWWLAIKPCNCPMPEPCHFAGDSLNTDTIDLDRATTYQPTIAQCDSTPFSTADGSRIDPDNIQRWCALSRDLLDRWGGPFNYGDTIEVYSEKHPQINGDWAVHDCMAPKYTLSIDFLGYITPKLGIGRDVKIIYCAN